MSTITRSSPTASRRAMSTGRSCIVEQFGLAMMPSCHSPSSGFTWLTMSGTAGVHSPRVGVVDHRRSRAAAASGASMRETSPPAEKRAMSTPSNASGVASPTVRVCAAGAHGRPGGPAGGEQTQARRPGSGARRGPGSSFDRRRRSHRRPRRSAGAILRTWLHCGTWRGRFGGVYQRTRPGPGARCMAVRACSADMQARRAPRLAALPRQNERPATVSADRLVAEVRVTRRRGPGDAASRPCGRG